MSHLYERSAGLMRHSPSHSFTYKTQTSETKVTFVQTLYASERKNTPRADTDLFKLLLYGLTVFSGFVMLIFAITSHFVHF